MDAPETIGRYRIERLLGQGAMGSVYLGVDPSLERRVAVKTVRNLDLDEAAKKRFLDRFRNEARAAARLSHPSIVQVYDVGDEPGLGPYLVLELIDGPSLKQVLRDRGPLEPAELVSVAAQLAEAIDTAHAAGIIHRDIKPDNVLVGEGCRAKLADFGVARVPDAALTREGQFLGTPCYAAPETLSAGRYGPATDLFSFAAMLYELATGVRAFPGDDAVAVAHAVIHDEPMPPSEAGRRELPRELDAVLLRGLAKSDAERYPSARALVDAIDDALVAAGRLSSPGERERPRASSLLHGESARRRGLLGIVLLALLGAAALSAHALGGVDALLDALLSADPIADAGGVELEAGEALLVEPPRHHDASSGAALATEAADSSDAGLDASGALLDAAPASDAARPLSPREIEDLAKDELDAARAAIDRGDRRAARAHLDRARALDPTSGDLDEIEALLAPEP